MNLLKRKMEDMWNFNERDVVLVDIGEILRIACVKRAKNFCDNVYELETKTGKVLTKNGLLSHQQPEVDVVLPCGVVAQVFDERICALNYSFNQCSFSQVAGASIKKGDCLPLMDSDSAWTWIRNNCEYNLIDVSFHWMRLRRKWITIDGCPTDEPSWFVPKLAMVTVLSSLHYIDIGHAGLHEYEHMQHWLNDIVTLSQDWYLTIEEFDRLTCAGKAISVAAKTINHHVDKGDFRPNQDKIREFEKIDFGFIVDSSRKSDFAMHLKESYESVLRSKRGGYRQRVEMVYAYHPGRFRNTYVR